ncbi:jg2934 [Pararge aegeria aegeria]|uniref:Jg2934 protein n=1 Tax=Pararge aegeria aegeria TaxID=348720 RepID=A0A8S4SGJ6_9NEOP|nr:jg2934 [Pararge aegeria aegeria]
MDRKSFSIVLSMFFMLTAAEANSIQSITNLKWDHGLSATVNDYVDKTIKMIVPFLQENGLDPMELPEIIEGFEVRPVIITYSAWLRLHDGQMRGLVNVDRHSDQHVKYYAKMLRVRVQLQFTNLEFDYKYLVKVMNIGPTGGIIGSLDRFIIIADVLIDFNNDEIHLQQFSITNIGRLRVRLTGNILTDWLVNPVIGVFTRVFNTIIMKVVELNIRNAAQTAIGSINSSIRDIIDVIESHN